MSLTNDDIATIMRLVRESSFDKLELTDGELSLTICSAAAIQAERQGVAGAAAGTRPGAGVPGAGARAPTETAPPGTEPAHNAPPGNAAAASSPADAVPSSAPRSPAGQETAADAAEEGGAGETAVVEAPSVGVFYVAPEPGAPPFVSPGDHVGADDAVGLLEAMKVFTTVYAGQAGMVLEILAENDTLVETGEPLIALRPDR